MADTILERIQAAEEEAQSIRAQAGREARDLVKAAEEEMSAKSRQAAKAQTEDAQRRIEMARVMIGDEIKALEVQRSAQREAMKKEAAARVEQAGKLIFERVVMNGHR